MAAREELKRISRCPHLADPRAAAANGKQVVHSKWVGPDGRRVEIDQHAGRAYARFRG